MPRANREGIGHPTANQEGVDPAHEIGQQIQLGRHFRAADDGDQWPVRTVKRLREVMELRLHESSGGGGQ